jgi:hypothetical protein
VNEVAENKVQTSDPDKRLQDDPSHAESRLPIPQTKISQSEMRD